MTLQYPSIYLLPLEIMDMRYTRQWYEWFREVMGGNDKIRLRIIMPSMEEIKPDVTAFFDWKRTLNFKHYQLAELFAQPLESGDWVFIMDGEFPGIESLHYFEKMCGHDIGIAQIWHAGTYDKWDATYQKGLRRIGSKCERVWMDIADVIFVASEWHKHLIIKNKRVADPKKVKVTGLPVDVKGLRKKYDYFVREFETAFTGRLTKEKGFDVVERMQRLNLPEIIVTQKHGWNKENYYHFLGRCKRVFAPSRQETFGYGVVEGMACGCMPVVPDGLSFTDYVPRRFRYQNEHEMKELLSAELNSEDNFYRLVDHFQYQEVIKKMIEWLKY